MYQMKINKKEVKKIDDIFLFWERGIPAYGAVGSPSLPSSCHPKPSEWCATQWESTLAWTSSYPRSSPASHFLELWPRLLRTPASVRSASGSPGICLSHPAVLPSALPSRHPSSEHLRAFPPSFRLLVCLPSPAPLSPYGSGSVHWTIHPPIPSSCCSAHIRLARHPSGCGIRRLARCSPAP
nr:eukaryotic translation initiation factor 4E type 3 isoform X2 [Ovis aries]